MRLEFQIPGLIRPPLSMNQRLHWTVQHRTKTELREAVEWGLRTVERPASVRRPVRIVLVWRVADKRRRDLDNPAPTQKVVQDAVAAWLGIDDSYNDVWPGIRIEQGAERGVFIEVTDNASDAVAAMERASHE